MADMEVDTPIDAATAPTPAAAPKKKGDGKDKKRFEVKRVRARSRSTRQSLCITMHSVQTSVSFFVILACV